MTVRYRECTVSRDDQLRDNPLPCQQPISSVIQSIFRGSITGPRQGWCQSCLRWPFDPIISDYTSQERSHINFRIYKDTLQGVNEATASTHDDVIKWKYFPRNWSFVLGIHRSPVNSPHKGQWHGALMFSLICTWTNSWANIGDASDLRCHCAHYDVTVMCNPFPTHKLQYYSFNMVAYFRLYQELKLNLKKLVVSFKTNSARWLFDIKYWYSSWVQRTW